MHNLHLNDSAKYCAAAIVFVVFVAAPPGASAGRGADGEYDQRKSSHFILYQDVDIDRTSGFYGSRRFEQEVLQVLEGAYRSLDSALGMRPSRTIEVTIHDPQIFQQRFAGMFRFPAAGFYGGTIHIRGETSVSDRLIQVLHHELVHAAFDSSLPTTVLPAWFNEGVAEWFEARAVGRHNLLDWQTRVLAERLRAGQLFALSDLSSANLGALGPQAASLAYLESYGFVDFLAQLRGERRLRDLCRRLIRTGDLNDSLRRIFRSDLAALEASFFDALRGTAY
ncbi:MAG: hypothetical protein IH881_05955 [Myxococcales bacterium]|nr:hypothetical protein [Myxococcales bacterium]